MKVKNAQNAGAVAAIVTNVGSSPSPNIPGTMGTSAPPVTGITIPSVLLGLNDGNALKANLVGCVNVTLAFTQFTGLRIGEDEE